MVLYFFCTLLQEAGWYSIRSLSLVWVQTISSFSTPLLLIVKDLIFGYKLPDIEGMAFRSSLVKALPNCPLRMVDFSFGSL